MKKLLLVLDEGLDILKKIKGKEKSLNISKSTAVVSYTSIVKTISDKLGYMLTLEDSNKIFTFYNNTRVNTLSKVNSWMGSIDPENIWIICENDLRVSIDMINLFMDKNPGKISDINFEFIVKELITEGNAFLSILKSVKNEIDMEEYKAHLSNIDAELVEYQKEVNEVVSITYDLITTKELLKEMESNISKIKISKKNFNDLIEVTRFISESFNSLYFSQGFDHLFMDKTSINSPLVGILKKYQVPIEMGVDVDRSEIVRTLTMLIRKIRVFIDSYPERNLCKTFISKHQIIAEINEKLKGIR